MTAAEHLLYGTVRSDDGAVTFNHTDVIQGAEDVAAISAITVYTSKISQPEGDEDIIVDVAFEYSVGSSLREAGPFHPAAGSALSNTFGLPGSNITEVVGAFSPRGLTFICFKTNKRTHMYGKAVESSRGGSSFSIVVPANQRLLGLRGQVGRADADVGDGGPVAAIQNVAPVFADLPYLDTVKVSAATMGGKKDESKTKEKNRRKLTRVSGRSANSSLVSSIGSQQSSDAAKSPSADTSARSQLPEGKSSKKKGFVTVARWWKHPLGNEIEGEFVGDRVNGRATFTWHNGDRYVGQVQDGIAHGWGVFTVAKSGDTYNGSFEGGDMRGWGTMRFGNGDQYEGAFEQGQAYGQGHMIAATGDRYVGNYVDGHAWGQGIKVWSDGRKYAGEWKKGREHGKGRMEWADGSWCEGHWNKGQMHGQGVLINSVGDKYEGGWRWHKLHGAGTWTFASGVVFHGRWENGNVGAKGQLSHLPPLGSTLSQPDLHPPAKSSPVLGGGHGGKGGEDLEVLEAIISFRRQSASARTARADVLGGGVMRASEGTTSVAVPSAAHIMPYGGPNADDLEGRGNEWDMQSVSSRASECDMTADSLSANARDPASWKVGADDSAMAGGGLDEKQVQLMAGMPEAMGTGVGVPASALLEAALQRVLRAGTDAERAQAQNAIRVGLVQLDSDRRKRRLKAISAPAVAGKGPKEAPSALAQVHMQVSDLLAEHNNRMQAVRQKHSQPPDRSGCAAAPKPVLDLAASAKADAGRPGARVGEAPSKRMNANSSGGGGGGEGFALNDSTLLHFLTDGMPSVDDKRGAGWGRERDDDGTMGIGGCGEEMEGGGVGGRHAVEKSKAKLKALVRELEEKRLLDESFDGNTSGNQRLADMARMGIDISAFQSSPSKKDADQFGNDVDYVAGMLRNAVASEKMCGVSEEDVQDERELEERWKASLAESMAAADKSKRAMEKRRVGLEQQRLAAVLQEAQASREREREEQRLRKELAVAAAEERTLREEEERRALMVQLEAEVLVEMETQRRTTEEHRRAAKELQARRKHIEEQRKDQSRSLSTSVAAPATRYDMSADDDTPAAALAVASTDEEVVFVGRLREALGDDFISFQRSFRMVVGDPDTIHGNGSVAEAIQSSARAPSAPVVAILLEAVAAHNEGKVTLGKVLQGMWQHGYQEQHFAAVDVLKKVLLRRLAVERRRRAQVEIAAMEVEMLLAQSGGELERERERERERVRAERRARGLPENTLEEDADASVLTEDLSPHSRVARKALIPPRSELEEAEAAAAAILEILGETSDPEPSTMKLAASAAAAAIAEAANTSIVRLDSKVRSTKGTAGLMPDIDSDLEGLEDVVAEAVKAGLRLPMPLESGGESEAEKKEQPQRSTSAPHMLNDIQQELLEVVEEVKVEVEVMMDEAAVVAIPSMARGKQDRVRVQSLREQKAAAEEAAAEKARQEEEAAALKKQEEEAAALRQKGEQAAALADEQRLKEEEKRTALLAAQKAAEEEAEQQRLTDEAERLKLEQEAKEKKEEEAHTAEAEAQAIAEAEVAGEAKAEAEMAAAAAAAAAEAGAESQAIAEAEAAGAAEVEVEANAVEAAAREEEAEDVAEELEEDVDEEEGMLEEEEGGASLEEEYRKEMAATKIQAIERGRRQRSKREQVKQAQQVQDRAAMQELAVASALPEHDFEVPVSPSLTASAGRTDTVAPNTPAAEQQEVEEKQEQERRRRIESRIAQMPVSSDVTAALQAESAGTEAAATLSPETPQTGAPGSEKRVRKMLKPLPAVTMPHNDPAVAMEMMTDKLGDPPDVWKIEWKDLEMKTRIGVGNFAQVYRARYMREECAVKRFTHQTMSSKEFGAFINETAFLHRLRHPHICQLFGACVDAGNFCIVTEFVPNGNLHTVLTRRKNNPLIAWRTRVQMGVDLASAVAFLHAQTPAVLHLDIKSPNLLVDEDMRLKLADFGLARVKSPEDQVADKETFQPGTVHWMAPELMTKGLKTEKTDVYAIAVVLWELWVMKTPYEGLKVNDIAVKVRGGARPVVPDDVDPAVDLNETFKVLVEQCWHEDAAQRPSASQLQESLGSYLATLPSTDRTYSS